MSLTSRIQDQKDHITQAKKDLCSKVGIPSEPLPSFSEIIGSVPSPSLSDIIKFDIPETYQEGSVTYYFQSFQRPWIKICGPNQLITEINYTSSRNYFTLEAIYNLITRKTKTRISQPSPSIGGVADPKPFRSYHSKYYMEIYDPDSFEVQLHVLDHTKEVPEVVHRTTYSKNRAFLGYADGVLDAEGNFWFWDCKLVSGNMDLYYWSGKLNENGVPTLLNNGTRWEKVSIATSTGAWDPHLYVDFDENKDFLYVLSDRFNYKWGHKTSQLISDGFSTDWVGQSVNKYWVGILRKTDETNNKDYHYCFFQTPTSYQVYLLAWDENSQRYKNFGFLYSNYVATSSDIIQFGFFNYNGNIYIMYQVKGKSDTADYRATFILNNIGQIDKIFPKEKYGITQ